jgi:hypothetical protein
MVKMMDIKRFNQKLNEKEVKEQYQVIIKNKCATVEILEEDDDDGDINTAWDTY